MPLAAAASLRATAGFDPARLWLAGFPLASLAFFVARPDGAVTLAIGAGLSLALCTAALIATADEKGEWRRGHDLIAGIAPLQFAAAIWLAVTFAAEIVHGFAAGAAAAVATIPVALGALIALLFVEAWASAALLLAVRHGRPGGETAIALLASGKYAGVLGRLV